MCNAYASSACERLNTHRESDLIVFFFSSIDQRYWISPSIKYSRSFVRRRRRLSFWRSGQCLCLVHHICETSAYVLFAAPTHPHAIRYANMTINSALFAFAEKQFFAIIVVSSVQSVRLRLQMRNVLLSFILQEKCAESKIKYKIISLYEHIMCAVGKASISCKIAEQVRPGSSTTCSLAARESNLSRLHFFVWFFFSVVFLNLLFMNKKLPVIVC